MYVYIYIYKHIYARTCIYIYIYTLMCMHTHTTLIYFYPFVLAHTRICTISSVCTCLSLYVRFAQMNVWVSIFLWFVVRTQTNIQYVCVSMYRTYSSCIQRTCCLYTFDHNAIVMCMRARACPCIV